MRRFALVDANVLGPSHGWLHILPWLYCDQLSRKLQSWQITWGPMVGMHYFWGSFVLEKNKSEVLTLTDSSQKTWIILFPLFFMNSCFLKFLYNTRHVPNAAATVEKYKVFYLSHILVYSQTNLSVNWRLYCINISVIWIVNNSCQQFYYWFIFQFER